MSLNDKKKVGFYMSTKNQKEEMQSVTIRVPKDLYREYKQVLFEQGKIVTYDLRKYMGEVVQKQKKGQN